MRGLFALGVQDVDMNDRYGQDVLRKDPHAPRRKVVPEVPADLGLVVECSVTGFCGAVVGLDKGATGLAVLLEDRHGTRRPFLLSSAGFLLDGAHVTLVRPQVTAAAPTHTASGSVPVVGGRARVARAARIWVEGRHDAELVEKVWGADLRVEGVVVEPLHGIDDLAARIAEFGPGPDRRLGVLVDHLVAGSKETRIAAEASRGHSDSVLVLGHPYVDVWQSIRPTVLGISAWPVIPRGTSWKHGMLQELGRPATTDSDVAQGWKWLLGQVTNYADLEPSLTGRVEQLIDFVTAGA
jgi:hypothetical protein